MTWVTVAVVAGSAIGGAAISAEGAKDAAAEQSRSAGEAGVLSEKQFNLSRQDAAPYRQAGSAAVSRIRELLGIAGPTKTYRPDVEAEILHRMDAFGHSRAQAEDDVQKGWGYQPTVTAPNSASVGDLIQQDPSYQFRFNEGQRALRNIAGARGVLNSGQTAKEMTQYGQDLASTEYGNIYNRLANVAGMGQGAVNTGTAAGANYAGTVGGYMTGAGNARGASAIGQANSYGGALNTVGNYYAQQKTLNQILNRPQTPTPGYGGYGGGSPY